MRVDLPEVVDHDGRQRGWCRIVDRRLFIGSAESESAGRLEDVRDDAGMRVSEALHSLDVREALLYRSAKEPQDVELHVAGLERHGGRDDEAPAGLSDDETLMRHAVLEASLHLVQINVRGSTNGWVDDE